MSEAAEIKVKIIGDVTKTTKNEVLRLAAEEFERCRKKAHKKGVLTESGFRVLQRRLKEDAMRNMASFMKEKGFGNLNMAPGKGGSFAPLVAYICGYEGKDGKFSIPEKETYTDEYTQMEKLYKFTVKAWEKEFSLYRKWAEDEEASAASSRMLHTLVKEWLTEAGMPDTLQAAVVAWYVSFFPYVIRTVPGTMRKDMYYSSESAKRAVTQLFAYMQKAKEAYHEV